MIDRDHFVRDLLRAALIRTRHRMQRVHRLAAIVVEVDDDRQQAQAASP